MILTHPSFTIAPLSVASPLTSPLLPSLLPFLAPERCLHLCFSTRLVSHRQGGGMADDLLFSFTQIKPETVYSFLRSIAGFSSSSFSSRNFPNCSSYRELSLVYTAYLRSHFSVFLPKTLRSRARDYLSELRRARCPKEFYLSFCSPFSPTEFFVAASNLSSSIATGPDKVAYPMLKHLPRSGMDFLLYIFNLS